MVKKSNKQVSKPANAPVAPQQVVSTQAAVAAATVVPTRGAKADTIYTVVAPKRPLTGLKYGAKGNEATHHALAAYAAEHGGKITYTEALTVCKAQSHASFLGYAIRRLRVLVPVEEQTVATTKAA
jgi:hypothetical protein